MLSKFSPRYSRPSSRNSRSTAWASLSLQQRREQLVAGGGALGALAPALAQDVLPVRQLEHRVERARARPPSACRGRAPARVRGREPVERAQDLEAHHAVALVEQVRCSTRAASLAGKRLIVRGIWRRSSCGKLASPSDSSRNCEALGAEAHQRRAGGGRTSCRDEHRQQRARASARPAAAPARSRPRPGRRRSGATASNCSVLSKAGDRDAARSARATARRTTAGRSASSGATSACTPSPAQPAATRSTAAVARTSGLSSSIAARSTRSLGVRAVRARSAAARVSGSGARSSRSASGTKSWRPELAKISSARSTTGFDGW